MCPRGGDERHVVENMMFHVTATSTPRSWKPARNKTPELGQVGVSEGQKTSNEGVTLRSSIKCCAKQMVFLGHCLYALSRKKKLLEMNHEHSLARTPKSLPSPAPKPKKNKALRFPPRRTRGSSFWSFFTSISSRRTLAQHVETSGGGRGKNQRRKNTFPRPPKKEKDDPTAPPKRKHVVRIIVCICVSS